MSSTPPKSIENFPRKIGYHVGRSQKTSIDNSNILTSSPTLDNRNLHNRTPQDSFILGKKEENILNENTSFRESIKETTKNEITQKDFPSKKVICFTNFENKYDYHNELIINNLNEISALLETDVNIDNSILNEKSFLAIINEKKEKIYQKFSEKEDEVKQLKDKYLKLKKENSLKNTISKGINSPLSTECKQLEGKNYLLEAEKIQLEKEISSITRKIKQNQELKSNLASKSRKRDSSAKPSKYEREIENIEREILESSIAALEKELLLKNKQIKLYREKGLKQEFVANSSESNEINEVVEDDYFIFEEDFNVTNNSNDSINVNPVNDSDNDAAFNENRKKGKFIKPVILEKSKGLHLDNEFKMFNKNREGNNSANSNKMNFNKPINRNLVQKNVIPAVDKKIITSTKNPRLFASQEGLKNKK